MQSDIMNTFRDSSKAEFVSSLSIEHINAGSLQRIADAMEKIAVNYDSLLRAKKSAEESRDFWRASAERSGRQNKSLRGHITRLKRKAHAQEEPRRG